MQGHARYSLLMIAATNVMYSTICMTLYTVLSLKDQVIKIGQKIILTCQESQFFRLRQDSFPTPRLLCTSQLAYV